MERSSGLLCLWCDHDVAVHEDGEDDEEAEHGVGEDEDGDPPDGVEGREKEAGVGRREPEDGAALGHHHEGAAGGVVGVDITDRDVGQLQREFAVAARKVVS